MADKKISALTAATTPLAGTEVLPIVQSSTTKKVSVADLSKGRTIQATGINDNNNNEVITITTTASAVNELTVANAATGANPVISATGSDTNIGITLTPKGTGNAVLTSGNLVIGTSGNGIDFSATASGSGTMTSELLADYEEGTWTPAFTFATAGNFALGTPIVQAGRYTRIGRQVVCSFSIVTTPTWTTASSYLLLTGLPFTAANVGGPGYGPVSFTNVTKAGYTSYCLEVEANQTRAYLTGSSNGGGAGYSILAADMTSGVQTVLQGTVMYTV